MQAKGTATSHHAFNNFWDIAAHPNVYTDEGKPAGKGVGKELCDLLVVFGDDIIVFSDKHCGYKETGNDDVDWKRWYRKAVTKSASQLRGAASFIQRFPGRLFLDAECMRPFPLKLPEPQARRIHLVAVTRGSHEACERYFANASIGSLRFVSDVKADEAPFTLGPIQSPYGLIHVFDEYTLDVVFSELDTVPDFVLYLQKRAAFLGGPATLLVDGEEQLLALYLTTLDANNQHGFAVDHPDDGKPLDGIYVSEGHWESLTRNPQYLAKKSADKVSYAWDRLITQFIDYGHAGVLPGVMDKWGGDTKPGVRVMAMENRLYRRILGGHLVDFLGALQPDKSWARVMRSGIVGDRAYVLLAEPFHDGYKDYNDYREYRLARLSAYVEVSRLRVGTAKTVVGLAFDVPTKDRRSGSEDLFCTFVPEFTREYREHAEQVQREFGLLLPERTAMQERKYQEFPDVSRERNRPASLSLGRMFPRLAHPSLAPTRKQRRAAARAQEKAERKRK